MSLVDQIEELLFKGWRLYARTIPNERIILMHSQEELFIIGRSLNSVVMAVLTEDYSLVERIETNVQGH